MMGMEKMLAGMLGMSPEEMQAAATQVKDGLLTVAGKLEMIDRKCDQILEELNNDASRKLPAVNGHDRSSARRKRGTGAAD